jgi:tetratricopeptide (TPR) repeat protein
VAKTSPWTDHQNDVAWFLATSADARFREPTDAVKLAEKAVNAQPANGEYRNTLGVAKYRAGNWQAAVDDLTKAAELNGGKQPFDWLFLAMAHGQLGHREQAVSLYQKAIKIAKDQQKAVKDAAAQQPSEELARFTREATDLLGLKN